MTSVRTKTAAAFVLGASLSLGCGILKKKQPEPSASATVTPTPVPSPVVTPTTTTPVEPITTVADEAVPTPEDFEEEAFTKVTAATYKAELATLRKEIEGK